WIARLLKERDRRQLPMSIEFSRGHRGRDDSLTDPVEQAERLAELLNERATRDFQCEGGERTTRKIDASGRSSEKIGGQTLEVVANCRDVKTICVLDCGKLTGGVAEQQIFRVDGVAASRASWNRERAQTESGSGETRSHRSDCNRLSAG